ncbi:MAG TPA: hypothetical protein VFU88_20090 [Ktedonobacterales bacterium]|nr:hypothetical protein [Ktedonobacterales bacterium]
MCRRARGIISTGACAWRSIAWSLALHHNNLLGDGAIGVQNAGGGVVDATRNYWGCSGGPGAPGCSTVQGTVDFTPWLTHRV